MTPGQRRVVEKLREQDQLVFTCTSSDGTVEAFFGRMGHVPPFAVEIRGDAGGLVLMDSTIERARKHALLGEGKTCTPKSLEPAKTAKKKLSRRSTKKT